MESKKNNTGGEQVRYSSYMRVLIAELNVVDWFFCVYALNIFFFQSFLPYFLKKTKI